MHAKAFNRTIKQPRVCSSTTNVRIFPNRIYWLKSQLYVYTYIWNFCIVNWSLGDKLIISLTMDNNNRCEEIIILFHCNPYWMDMVVIMLLDWQWLTSKMHELWLWMASNMERWDFLNDQGLALMPLQLLWSKAGCTREKPLKFIQGRVFILPISTWVPLFSFLTIGASRTPLSWESFCPYCPRRIK